MPLMGDSIEMTVKFRNFNDEYADPDSIVFKVYDTTKKQIGETVDVGVEYKQSLGVYKYQYTIPSINEKLLPKGDCKLVCEFTGILDGMPIVTRKEIDRRWK